MLLLLVTCLYFPFTQGHGGTVTMCWNQVKLPVGSICSGRRVPTGSCRPGVSRVKLREGGRSSRGDKMGQSTSSETGNIIRYRSETSNLIKHNQVFHRERVTNTNLLPLKNHLKPMLFKKCT